MSETLDDYLSKILRGELPDELKTTFQALTKESFASLIGAFTTLFVSTHQEFQIRYAPSVPREVRVGDILYWLARRTEELLGTIRSDLPSAEYEAVGAVLAAHFEQVDRLLHAYGPQSPRDFPRDNSPLEDY